MTPAQFRKLALAMPDVIEGSHHDHPDFRANGRVFASLHPDGARAMVKVSLDEQRRLVESRGETFAPATGAWGRAGCTMVRLHDVVASDLEGPMTLAWQETVMRPGVEKAAKTKKTKKSKKTASSKQRR